MAESCARFSGKFAIALQCFTSFLRRLNGYIITPLALVHFCFASFAMLDLEGGWIASFFFTHTLLVLCGFLSSLDKTGWQPIVSFIVILVVSAIADIAVLGLWFQIILYQRIGKFTSVMIILNLIIKPVTLVFSVFALFLRRESFKLECNIADTADPRSGSYQTFRDDSMEAQNH